MTPSRAATTFLLSFILSVFLLQWWQAISYPPFVWYVLAWGLIISCAGSIHPVTYRIAPWIALVFLGVILAFLTVERNVPVASPETVDGHAEGKKVTVQGMIADDPDRRALLTYYTLASLQIDETGSGGWIPVTGTLRVTDLKRWPEFRYGDRVTVTGKLKEPEPESADYLAMERIFAVMTAERITASGENAGSAFFSSLFTLRHWFEGTLNLLFPEPHASLAAGLLTGSRRGIPESLLKDFTTVGLTHIIAISGTNITIIMTLIAGSLFWMPFRWRLMPTVFAITAFTFFVGASASVVRAAIMGSLGLLAVTVGRQADTRLAILWTAAAMIFWNPARLWTDGGFQLSFAAVIGLTELTPILLPLFQRIPQALGLRESLLTTISAQLTAMPLTVLLFGNLSIIAPVANVLVAPVIPLAMLFGALSVAGGALWMPLGKLIALPGWMCLSWITGVAQVLARVPGASFHFEKASIVILILYYLILAGGVLFITYRSLLMHFIFNIPRKSDRHKKTARRQALPVWSATM